MTQPAGASAPNPPRLSTTVMLLRDAPQLEVLMVARAYEIDFASGALVFPGGKVEAADRDAAWADLSDGSSEGEDLALRVAAARECFEEVGVLFAQDSGAPQGALIDVAAAEAHDAKRKTVEADATLFKGLVSEARLRLALEHFVPYARWTAPEIAPKRFDTQFFLARFPEGQKPVSDGRETTEALWISPQEALARSEAGEATIIFPTRMNLRRLSQCGSVDEALERFAAEPMPRIQPQVVKDAAGAPCLTLPADAGYGEVMEPLASVMGQAPKKSG